MNPRPKFCVGEEVIIQCNRKPELNGQRHEILHIKFMEKPFNLTTGEIYPSQWGYLTTALEKRFGAASLRKLPPKADPWEDCIFNPLKLTV